MVSRLGLKIVALLGKILSGFDFNYSLHEEIDLRLEDL